MVAKTQTLKYCKNVVGKNSSKTEKTEKVTGVIIAC